jgi:hypothetical protein
LYFFDIPSNQISEKFIIDQHRASVTTLCFSHDGKKLFSGDAAGMVLMTVLDFDEVRRT